MNISIRDRRSVARPRPSITLRTFSEGPLRTAIRFQGPQVDNLDIPLLGQCASHSRSTAEERRRVREVVNPPVQPY